MCGGVDDVGDGVGWGGWANNVDVWWRSCWGWGGVGGLTTLMCGGVDDVGDGVGWGGWANNVHVWWRSC